MAKDDPNVEVVRDDLATLLFWASVGAHLSKGGYNQEEIPHILESYAEAINFSLPYPPKFQVEKFKTFRGAGG